MPVSAKGVGLSDREPCRSDRLATEIQNTSRDFDDFALRLARAAADDSAPSVEIQIDQLRELLR
jgi:hypothetical protein